MGDSKELLKSKLITECTQLTNYIYNYSSTGLLYTDLFNNKNYIKVINNIINNDINYDPKLKELIDFIISFTFKSKQIKDSAHQTLTDNVKRLADSYKKKCEEETVATTFQEPASKKWSDSIPQDQSSVSLSSGIESLVNNTPFISSLRHNANPFNPVTPDTVDPTVLVSLPQDTTQHINANPGYAQQPVITQVAASETNASDTDNLMDPETEEFGDALVEDAELTTIYGNDELLIDTIKLYFNTDEPRLFLYIIKLLISHFQIVIMKHLTPETFSQDRIEKYKEFARNYIYNIIKLAGTGTNNDKNTDISAIIFIEEINKLLNILINIILEIEFILVNNLNRDIDTLFQNTIKDEVISKFLIIENANYIKIIINDKSYYDESYYNGFDYKIILNILNRACTKENNNLLNNLFEILNIIEDVYKYYIQQILNYTLVDNVILNFSDIIKVLQYLIDSYIQCITQMHIMDDSINNDNCWAYEQIIIYISERSDIMLDLYNKTFTNNRFLNMEQNQQSALIQLIFVLYINNSDNEITLIDRIVPFLNDVNVKYRNYNARLITYARYVRNKLDYISIRSSFYNKTNDVYKFCHKLVDGKIDNIEELQKLIKKTNTIEFKHRAYLNNISFNDIIKTNLFHIDCVQYDSNLNYESIIIKSNLIFNIHDNTEILKRIKFTLNYTYRDDNKHEFQLMPFEFETNTINNKNVHYTNCNLLFHISFYKLPAQMQIQRPTLSNTTTTGKTLRNTTPTSYKIYFNDGTQEIKYNVPSTYTSYVSYNDNTFLFMILFNIMYAKLTNPIPYLKSK